MNDRTWRENMQADLIVAGMAQRTQEAYLRAVRQLSQYCNGTPPEALSEQQVKDYLLWLRSEKRDAPETLKIAIGGLPFFYRQTCPPQWTVLDRFCIPTANGPHRTGSTADHARHSTCRKAHHRCCGPAAAVCINPLRLTLRGSGRILADHSPSSLARLSH